MRFKASFDSQLSTDTGL